MWPELCLGTGVLSHVSPGMCIGIPFMSQPPVLRDLSKIVLQVDKLVFLSYVALCGFPD